mgnify:CR=1 FL=1
MQQAIFEGYRGLRAVCRLGTDWMLTVAVVAGALAVGATVLAG